MDGQIFLKQFSPLLDRWRECNLSLLNKIKEAIELFLKGELNKKDIECIATALLMQIENHSIAGYDFLDLQDIMVVKNPREFGKQELSKLTRIIEDMQNGHQS